jgi:hypothetical protein
MDKEASRNAKFEASQGRNRDTINANAAKISSHRTEIKQIKKAASEDKKIVRNKAVRSSNLDKILAKKSIEDKRKNDPNLFDLDNFEYSAEVSFLSEARTEDDKLLTNANELINVLNEKYKKTQGYRGGGVETQRNDIRTSISRLQSIIAKFMTNSNVSNFTMLYNIVHDTREFFGV